MSEATRIGGFQEGSAFTDRDGSETSLGRATLKTAVEEEEPNLSRIVSGFAIVSGIAALALGWLPYAMIYFSSLAFIFGSWHFVNVLSSSATHFRYHYFKAWIEARREQKIARRVRHSKILAQRIQIRKLRSRLKVLRKKRSSVVAMEQAALSDLSQRTRETQLEQFLSNHSLRDHVDSIPLIGKERLKVLESCGIRTASDVNYKRILAMPGCSHAVAASLMSWRNDIISRFSFGPENLPQEEVAGIVREYHEQRQRIDEESIQTEDRQRSRYGTLRTEVIVLDMAVHEAEVNVNNAWSDVHTQTLRMDAFEIAVAATAFVLPSLTILVSWLIR